MFWILSPYHCVGISLWMAFGTEYRHSHPNHRPCRAWQSSHPEKKKLKKYPLDKKNERNMEWILGLKPKDNMNWYERVWAHSRFIRALVWRFGNVWTLLHWISMASIFISPSPKKKKKKCAERFVVWQLIRVRSSRWWSSAVASHCALKEQGFMGMTNGKHCSATSHSHETAVIL